MQGRHPVAVLMLELPRGEVDVNVHPTKREVRLKNFGECSKDWNVRLPIP